MSATSLAGHVLIWIGAGLILLAGIGVLRFPDVLTRASAATKSTGLGLALVLVGSALEVGTGRAAMVLGAAVLIQFLTAPVSGHVIGRAAYRSGAPLWSGTHTDELRGHYRRRTAAAADAHADAEEAQEAPDAGEDAGPAR